jgi:hypothetical protein
MNKRKQEIQKFISIHLSPRSMLHVRGIVGKCESIIDIANAINGFNEEEMPKSLLRDALKISLILYYAFRIDIFEVHETDEPTEVDFHDFHDSGKILRNSLERFKDKRVSMSVGIELGFDNLDEGNNYYSDTESEYDESEDQFEIEEDEQNRLNDVSDVDVAQYEHILDRSTEEIGDIVFDIDFQKAIKDDSIISCSHTKEELSDILLTNKDELSTPDYVVYQLCKTKNLDAISDRLNEPIDNVEKMLYLVLMNCEVEVADIFLYRKRQEIDLIPPEKIFKIVSVKDDVELLKKILVLQTIHPISTNFEQFTKNKVWKFMEELRDISLLDESFDFDRKALFYWALKKYGETFDIDLGLFLIFSKYFNAFTVVCYGISNYNINIVDLGMQRKPEDEKYLISEALKCESTEILQVVIKYSNDFVPQDHILDEMSEINREWLLELLG